MHNATDEIKLLLPFFFLSYNFFLYRIGNSGCNSVLCYPFRHRSPQKTLNARMFFSTTFFQSARCSVLALLILSALPSFAQKRGKASPLGPYIHAAYKVDADADGVPDGRDECPSTPKGEKVTPFGCPIDTDFDGLYDSQDKCPTEPGPRENIGCPWGDRDKDGVKDNVDDCPDAAGPVSHHGCPDTDGDGLYDNEDECPTKAGPIERRGCPPKTNDTDGDGVDDVSDRCPETPGPKDNQGCPKLSATDQAKVSKAFKNLLFETGKAIIKPSSYASLNELAQVIRDNPGSNLRLEGHTDNVGNDDANMQLSKDRAAAVKTYLTDRGVGDDRIESEGYGETRPVAENNSAAGKQKNRRVEMKISYR
jgi:OmpA-OmpF porin, OOP family